MKHIHKILLFLFLLTNSIVFGQTAGFNYQALILNSTEIQIPGTDISENKVPLGLEDVTLRFSITNEDGIEYIEEHTVTTDENGMVSLIVGQGTAVTSTFNEIDWDGKLKHLNVELNILSNSESFVFLDSQEILYIPHPTKGSNVLVVTDTSNLSQPFNVGDLIWVTNFGPNQIPTLMIWNGTDWLPVSNDYDPSNELGLIVATDDTVRDTLLPNPVVGDQVWNQSCSCTEVYNGSVWVSTDASNGLYKDENGTKLGGELIEPTEITTSTTNTLAIKDLVDVDSGSGVVDSNDYNIIIAEKTTGILRTKSMSYISKQEQVVITATDGQLQFLTPIPITNVDKIEVYRNGARIDFIAINTTTIELEPEAICYENDKIRIVQLH